MWQKQLAKILIKEAKPVAEKLSTSLYQAEKKFFSDLEYKRFVDGMYKPVPSTSQKLKELGSRSVPSSPSKTALRSASDIKDLSKYTDGVNAIGATALASIALASNSGIVEIDKSLSTLKETNDAQKAKQGGSHFLNNQVDTKQSLDDLTGAINSQTVALFQVLSTISVHLASLVTASNATTGAIHGITPPSQTVTVESSAPTVNVSSTAPTVNVSSTAPTVNVSSTAPTVNVEAPIIPDYTDQMNRMAESADAVREHHEYLKTPLEAPDTSTETGTLELSPREAQHALNSHHARGEADENNIGGDLFALLEDLFDGDELNMIKLLAYSRIDEGFADLLGEDDSSYDAKIDARYNV